MAMAVIITGRHNDKNQTRVGGVVLLDKKTSAPFRGLRLHRRSNIEVSLHRPALVI